MYFSDGGHETKQFGLIAYGLHHVLELDFISKLYQYEQLVKDPTTVTRGSASLIVTFIASSGMNKNDHF